MAEIGPGLQKMIDQAHLPPWLATRFHDEGAGLQQASFAATMYVKGYGRDARFGLPTSEQALPTLLNPSAAFWSSTPQHKADRDWGVEHAPKLSSVTHWTLGPLEAIAKIPVLGPVIKAAAAPITTVAHLAEGQPLGQAALDNFKSQIGAIKAVGPYAASIVSFVPGIGTGVAAALAAGTALAEGKPIDEALEAGIKNAIPGGALVASGYELAKKVASGENVGKAALETARAQLPAEAQKAFDVGLAVVSGKQLQSAIVAGIASLAPNEVQQILSAGTKAIQSTPGLSTLAASLQSDAMRQGLQLASGALAHAGINETQLRAMRARLTGDVLKGFDTALQSQAAHTPWIANIVAPPASQPTQAQTDLQQLAQLTPEQQKQLVDLQALSHLTPEQQKQLTDYAKAQTAPPKPSEPAKKPTESSKPAAKPPEPTKPSAPKPPEPTRSAPSAPPAAPRPVGTYPPYPPMHGAVSGPPATYAPYPGTLSAPPPHPHQHPHPPALHTQHAMRTPGWHMRVPWTPNVTDEPASCLVWGAPVEMSTTTRWAAQSALAASKGQPKMVRAPDGTVYLFALENGSMTARPCASFG